MTRKKLYEIPYFRRLHKEADYNDPIESYNCRNHSSKRRNIKHVFKKEPLGTFPPSNLKPIKINGEYRIKEAVLLEKLMKQTKKENCYDL